MTPQVSILIPAYNNPLGINKALASIAGQTYKDYEVVITDDSPNNSVFNAVKAFPELPIRYFHNHKRLGSPANWNEAVFKSSGEYIKFLHHDDWFTYRHSLSLFVDALDTHPDSSIAFSMASACNGEGAELFVHAPKEHQLRRLERTPMGIFPTNFIGCPSSVIYRRKVGLFFDENLKWLVDMEFYYRLLKQNPRFVFIPWVAVSITADGPNQISKEYQNNAPMRWKEWAYLTKKIIRGN